MVEVLGFAVLLGYLQASIANMQDHRQPGLTILDFRFWIRDELVGIEGWFSSYLFTI